MRCRAVPPPCHFSGGGCLGGGISVSVISAGLGGVGDLGRSRQVSAVAAVSVVSAGLCGLGGLGGLVGGVTIANFCSIFFREALEREARRRLVASLLRIFAEGCGRAGTEPATKSIKKQPKMMPKPPKTVAQGCQNLLQTTPEGSREGFGAHLGPQCEKGPEKNGSGTKPYSLFGGVFDTFLKNGGLSFEANFRGRPKMILGRKRCEIRGVRCGLYMVNNVAGA